MADLMAGGKYLQPGCNAQLVNKAITLTASCNLTTINQPLTIFNQGVADDVEFIPVIRQISAAQGRVADVQLP